MDEMNRAATCSDAGVGADTALLSEGCAHDDLRCACGSLLARRVGNSVELKCRRCKRTVLIPFELEDGPSA
jgi:hypothetical protein